MSSGPPATRRVFLRQVGGTFADGTSLCEIAELDVLAWSATVTYALGTHVAGSDGHIYASAITQNKGINPVGDGGVHWKQLI